MVKSVLVVEDEPSVAQALCRVLTLASQEGYHVESCDSGESALACLAGNRFDLVITDLRMPGMSGLELLEQVRRISPTTRCILITAYGTPHVQDRVDHLADAYLPKPFGMRSFVATVEQALKSGVES